MTRAMLWLLLRVSPPGFRARCGDEFLAAYEWRLSRRRTPSDRLFLAIREMAGLSIVVCRLWSRALLHCVPVRFEANPFGRARDSAGWTGIAMSCGILLAYVGAGIAFSRGASIGFALVPFALLLLAAGLWRRASLARLRHGMVILARFTAVSSCALALLIGLMPLSSGVWGTWVSILRYPASLGLMVGSIVFGGLGIVVDELPVVPATIVSIGGVLVMTGFLGFEGVSLLGFSICVPGWIALGLAPWGRDRTVGIRRGRAIPASSE